MTESSTQRATTPASVRWRRKAATALVACAVCVVVAILVWDVIRREMAIKRLRQAVASENQAEITAAATRVNELGLARRAAWFLIQLCRSDSVMDRSVVRACVELDENSVPVLVNALVDEHMDVKSLASDALRQRALAGKSVTGLFDALHEDTDPKVRNAILDVLCRFGFEGLVADRAVPAVAEVLATDPIAENRLYAAHVLGAFGSHARSAGPDLVAALQDRDEYVALNAAAAILKVDRDHVGAAREKLHLLLKHDNPRVQTPAANLLARIDESEWASAAPVMLELLKSADGSVRASALFAVKSFGPAAESATPALVNVVKADADARCRKTAFLCLARIYQRNADPMIEDLLLNVGATGAEVDRISVIYALAMIADQSPRAKQDVVAALSAADSNTRLCACEALLRSDSLSNDWSVHVSRLLSDEHPVVRDVAQKIAERIAEKNTESNSAALLETPEKPPEPLPRQTRSRVRPPALLKPLANVEFQQRELAATLVLEQETHLVARTLP